MSTDKDYSGASPEAPLNQPTPDDASGAEAIPCDETSASGGTTRKKTNLLAPGGTKELRSHFDRMLIFASVLLLLCLYLPWLPGMYGSIPGWKIPYSIPDIPLDEIRHLDSVDRPDSIFLLNFIAVGVLVFCRTSSISGLRDLVASIVLVVGGTYAGVYFAGEWGWCFFYHYVGCYVAFAALAMVVASGLFRMRLIRQMPLVKSLLLLSGAFLITGWFLPR